MEGYNLNEVQEALAQFETPFGDIPVSDKKSLSESANNNFESGSYMPELESPFAQTFEPVNSESAPVSPTAKYYAELMGELESENFTEALYDMASELEDSWSTKVSNEYEMGEAYTGFVTKDSETYFQPILKETYNLIDKTSEYFSGNNLADHNEASIDRFFNEIAAEYRNFSPAQENFFGGVFNKIKSVVSKGVEFAKKGIAAIGKILPFKAILEKLKDLIKPLLNKVLQFALNKIPASLRPWAQKLANKVLGIVGLNSETGSQGEATFEMESLSTGNLAAVQSEFDHHVAQLFFSADQNESDNTVQRYEASFEMMEREAQYESGGYSAVPLDVARNQFIKELQELKPGESPQPAIERFLPAVLVGMQFAAKIAIKLIGRDKVINFLAGLLSKLVSKFVPAEVSMPLSTSIVDIGLGALGFEVNEAAQNNYAYEAISNTLEATIGSLNFNDENLLNDPNALATEVMEAFEIAASNHFPPQYLRESVRNSSDAGVWILKSKRIKKKLYKKYSTVINVTIDPRQAKEILGFNGLPLYNILKDQYGVDPDKTINARVHLFEAIPGTKLSYISRNEKVPGLMNNPYGYKLIQPLTKIASNVILKSATLGTDVRRRTAWYQTCIGQRFYFLEIPGARIVAFNPPQAGPALPANPYTTQSTYITPTTASAPITISTPSGPVVISHPASAVRPSDIQAVINFVKSEISVNYFFSEADAIVIGTRLQRNDYLGAAMSISSAVRNTLNGILLRDVSSKVKIIHEAMPEMYLENYEPQSEQFSPMAVVGSVAKDLLIKIIEKIIDKIASLAIKALENYFKARAAEFISAQRNRADGVTVKIVWQGVPGMSTISTAINAIRGRANLSVGSVTNLVLPSLPIPDVKVLAGKQFD